MFKRITCLLASCLLVTTLFKLQSPQEAHRDWCHGFFIPEDVEARVIQFMLLMPWCPDLPYEEYERGLHEWVPQ